MSALPPVGVVGARGYVGTQVLRCLRQAGYPVHAFGRSPRVGVSEPGITWHVYPPQEGPHEAFYAGVDIPMWICVGPIFAIAQFFQLFERHAAVKVLATSSTSIHSKVESSDPHEQDIARALAAGEAALSAWSTNRSSQWVVLRPTLVYGLGRDRNVSDIVRLIRRLSMFPVFGAAKGLRQPVRVEDVAQACLLALLSPHAVNKSYDLSGGEVLTYRDMVRRIFKALGKPALLIPVPLWLFRIAMTLLRRLPGNAHLSVAMAERMNKDLAFDHRQAQQDFGYRPRTFHLSVEDV